MKKQIHSILCKYSSLEIPFKQFQDEILEQYADFFQCEKSKCAIKMKDEWTKIDVDDYTITKDIVIHVLKKYSEGEITKEELRKWACVLFSLDNYDFDLPDELVDLFYILNEHMPEVYGEIDDKKIDEIVKKYG